MALQDFIDKLPADVQEAYKAETAKYVPISEAFNHKDVQSEFQRQLSIKHETTMANFQKDKLPGLIDEEIKRRGTKQPWEIEIEKMKAENADLQRQALLKDRKAQAIAELSKHGIDSELADFVVTDDEAKFSENINRLVGKVTSYRDTAVKTEKEKIFSTPSPRGQAQSADSLETRYNAAMASGDIASAMTIKRQISIQQ